MKPLDIGFSTVGRIVLAVLIVLAVTAFIGFRELHPMVATRSLHGQRLSAEVIATAIEQWLAMALTSAMAAGTATAILSLTTKMSGPRRIWAWVFVIVLMCVLPRVGVLWPEREFLLEGWIIHMGALYNFWPLLSVFPAVLLVHWFVPLAGKAG